MEFNEFVDVVKDLVRDKLPEKYQDAELLIRENDKINNHYMGLIAMIPGENVSPSVNLDILFDQYKSGTGISEIADQAAELLQSDLGNDIDFMSMLHYDKDKIFIRVCAAEQNQELLQDVPHQTMEDLAITYHVLAGEKDGNSYGSAIITNALMERYGISEDQLRQDAMENSPKLFPVQTTYIVDVLRDLMKNDPSYQEMSDSEIDALLKDTGPEEDMSMFVVTNDISLNGAAAVFYPHVMDQLAKQYGSGLILLPSSVHESATRFAV